MFSDHILSLLIWLPIVGGIAVMLVGDRHATLAKSLALAVGVATFVASFQLIQQFDPSLYTLQFAERFEWLSTFHSSYSLGVDGIAMPLIVLTTFSTIPVLIAGWEVIQKRPSQYYGAFLLLEGLMVAVFSATDALLFYVFWEAMLIPMFLIIGVWGGQRRVYATIKFFLYTFVGSVLMLVALVYLYLKGHTYDIQSLWALPLSRSEQIFIFLAFFSAFAVKVPMVPFHTWLPDAHVEAPTGGSVILAAIMLKMGGYGFMRFCLPVTPDAARDLSTFIIVISLTAVVYIGLVALVQRDMKKLIAYSSIAHMGFVTLGCFLAYAIVRQSGLADGSVLALSGAMVQMISHGLISGALFLCVGVLYDRLHTREIGAYGGVINTMPLFGAFMVFFGMSNAGLPGTSGFVGEFMVILASFHAGFWVAVLAGMTLILGAAYTLWLVKRVVLGPVANDNVASLTDINAREFFVLAVLAVAILVMGVYPKPLTDAMEPTLVHLAKLMLTSKL
jgi:NADH-quinone oxidoreductase subunit M